jgi:small nuclear ribonucleoprotein (snRNP)-like protein
MIWFRYYGGVQLFFSYFKDLVGKEVTVELKNDLAIRGTLHSVDQYLNIKLENTRVVDQDKYPHMVLYSLCCLKNPNNYMFFFFWNPTGFYVKLRSHVEIFMLDLMQFQEPHRMCNNGGFVFASWRNFKKYKGCTWFDFKNHIESVIVEVLCLQVDAIEELEWLGKAMS